MVNHQFFHITFGLLCIILIGNSGSSPARKISTVSRATRGKSHHDLHKRVPIGPHGKPQWMNPCGLDNSASPTYYYWAQTLQMQLRKALNYANNQKDNFTWALFHRPFQSQYNIDSSNQYLWLLDPPKLIKHTGQHLPKEHYQNLETAKVAEAYQILQRFSVGFEQMIFDANGNDASHLDIISFTQPLISLNRQILCTIYLAADEDDAFVLKPNATRKVMPGYLRHLPNEIDRNIRNFRIFKLYINVVEYYLDGLDFMLSMYDYFKTNCLFKPFLHHKLN